MAKRTFNNPSEMHAYRAKRAKQRADSLYAEAKQAEADGDEKKYFAFRAEATKYYNIAKEFEDLAKQEEGKPFAKKGKNKKADEN